MENQLICAFIAFFLNSNIPFILLGKNTEFKVYKFIAQRGFTIFQTKNCDAKADLSPIEQALKTFKCW
jgi:hypothetical protein